MLKSKCWKDIVSGRAKGGDTMKNLSNKVDDEIIEVEMIRLLGWVVGKVGGVGVRSAIVGGSWRCF